MDNNEPDYKPDIQPAKSILDVPENARQLDFPRVRWVLSLLLIATWGGAMLGLLAFQLIASLAGWGNSFLSGVLPEMTDAAGRNQMRLLLGLNHFSTFTLPGIFTLWLFYQRKNTGWIDYLRARKMPDVGLLGWSVLALIVSIPLVLFSYQINKLIPLPEVLHTLENDMTETLKNLLVMDTPSELLANLIVIALLPGIGEELLFRGVLQQQIQRRVSSPWIAIVITAIIFSAIHLQFEGFLPRVLLGLLLGWLYWRTGNFWIPVIAHFFNNGLQVVAQYLYGHQVSTLDLEKDVEIPWMAALFSVVLLWVTIRHIDRYHRQPSTVNKPTIGHP